MLIAIARGGQHQQIGRRQRRADQQRPRNDEPRQLPILAHQPQLSQGFGQAQDLFARLRLLGQRGEDRARRDPDQSRQRDRADDQHSAVQRLPQQQARKDDHPGRAHAAGETGGRAAPRFAHRLAQHVLVAGRTDRPRQRQHRQRRDDRDTRRSPLHRQRDRGDGQRGQTLHGAAHRPSPFAPRQRADGPRGEQLRQQRSGLAHRDQQADHPRPRAQMGQQPGQHQFRVDQPIAQLGRRQRYDMAQEIARLDLVLGVGQAAIAVGVLDQTLEQLVLEIAVVAHAGFPCVAVILTNRAGASMPARP